MAAGGSSNHQTLDEQAAELVRRIEHQLQRLMKMDDDRVTATAIECERALAEIKASLRR